MAEVSRVMSKLCLLLVAVNSSSRVSTSRTGRPLRIESAAATASYSQIFDLPPKPPPTATSCTMTCSTSRSSTLASSLRTMKGDCVVTHTSSTEASGSHRATTLLVSIQAWVCRPNRNVPLAVTAAVRESSGAPHSRWVDSETLPPGWIGRASGATASAMVVAARSTSNRTATSRIAASAASRVSAATPAISSPTKRTTSEARTLRSDSGPP
ncbi:unannotated protein [freshwater metagenome]|uniref:Unannotated protein n=1 Tax=freshwater metagenome TaxID=449393 RepID=A0A6J7LAH5_9ZZZZ